MQCSVLAARGTETPLAGERCCHARPRLSVYRLWSSKPGEGAEEVFMPATFSRMEVPEHAPLVQGYTTNGFVIAGNRVFGSVALLPRGLLHWKVWQ